ncbi:MAG: IS30 family transposase [Tissierellia bacterium]|nr:IS30 family transposase [Tissierellia bacterium]
MFFKTIYRWIYAGILTCGVSVLRQKGKGRKPQEKRGQLLLGTSIHKGPKSAKKRMEIGHWEADTMVSSRGKSKACFAPFLGRRSRLYLAVKIASRSAKSMKKAINWLIETLGKDCVRSITTDRGKELACYKQIEKRGVPVYFADPYSAWQRGTKENCNGLLREFFPKKLI